MKPVYNTCARVYVYVIYRVLIQFDDYGLSLPKAIPLRGWAVGECVP